MAASIQLAGVPKGLQALCHTAVGVSPLPMVAVYGDGHKICFANPAFLSLVGKSEEILIGSSFLSAGQVGDQCVADLNLVYETGRVQTRSFETAPPADIPNTSAFESYAMWPLVDDGRPPLGVMIQILESARFRRQAVAINEALLLSSLRQHEAAGLLNEQLRVEAVERSLALAALIKSEKLASLGRMAAAMAHEINNPLEAVTNTLYLARLTPDLPESARHFLDMADGELHRIAHITRQTLGFYRESSAAESFSVESLIDSALELLRSKIRSKRVLVSSKVDNQLFITAHFGELRQVISNLMLNSIDAIEPGGRVTVRAKLHQTQGSDKSHVRISISDNGQGIDPQALPQIFDPFFTTKGSIGNGLGLWVTRQIINKHQGTIRVRSSKLGPHAGTTFAVIVPQTAA